MSETSPLASFWAPLSEVRRWFLISALIATLMIAGVIITAQLFPGDADLGAHSDILSYAFRPPLETAVHIFYLNLLVLAIHFCAAYVGAIIARPHKPLPESMRRFDFLHHQLPKWAADLSLLYALSATLLSVALQTTGLGLRLADLAAALDVSPRQVMLMLLPHAFLELVGVFLPLGLFLIQARRRQLAPLGIWAWQAAFLALPLIAGAALIEAYLAPRLLTSLVM